MEEREGGREGRKKDGKTVTVKETKIYGRGEKEGEAKITTEREKG